jgi:hypothetical protein
MIMEAEAQTMSSTPRRGALEQGQAHRPEAALRPKHVWSIRTRLQMDERTRDLAMFNLAASCVAAMSSQFGSRTLHQAGMQSIARQFARRKPVGPSG